MFSYKPLVYVAPFWELFFATTKGSPGKMKIKKLWKFRAFDIVAHIGELSNQIVDDLITLYDLEPIIQSLKKKKVIRETERE